MTNMFAYCAVKTQYGLREVNVTGLDVSKVTSMDSMFSGDKLLTNIVGIDTLNTTGALTRMDTMFGDCEKLASLKFRAIPFNTILGSGVMPAFKPEKIKLIENNKKETEKDAFIAICRGKFLGENYSALVGPDFFS